MNAEMIKAISELIGTVVIIVMCVDVIYTVDKLYKNFVSVIDEHTKKIEEFEKRFEKIGG